MSSLHICNFPPELHATLKLVCLKQRTTLERLIPRIIREWLLQHHDSFPDIPREWINPNRGQWGH
jgi:hypothetical protein